MKIARKIYTVSLKQEEFSVNRTPIRSLHGSLKWVLFLAQCLGQMPVLGITEGDSRSLKFTWKSWRSVYCLLNCMGASFLVAFYLTDAVQHGIDIFLTSSIAFYVSTLTITVLFFKLAREWPQLMRKWASVEFEMRSYGWPKQLHKRITVMTITLLTAAGVEYLMVKIQQVMVAINYRGEQEFCSYYFTLLLYPHVFGRTRCNILKGVLLLVMNILTTFAWTFSDLFIILISTAVAVRFEQVTARMRLLLKNLKMDKVEVWKGVREDYNRLCNLTRNLDDALSYIVLTSFASNLFFILTQLFNSFRPVKDTWEKVYFFYSFGFLILRTLCVSLYGAWIYDESKEPINILNSVPSEIYNPEIKRFSEQIKFNTIALTGKKFFYVTRRLILSMTGAIVTYELVLIQFNQNLLKDEALQSNRSSTHH